MKKNIFRTSIFILLLAALILPASSVYAQGTGPGDGSGRVIIGSNLTIESGDTFEGDLVLFGGNVTIEEGAELNGDLVVIGGNVVSDGEMSGDVVIVGGQVKLEDPAVVAGNVILVGGQLDRSENATIEGDVFNNDAPQIDIPSGSIPPSIPGIPEIPNVPGVPEVPSVPGVVNFEFNPLFEFGQVFGSSFLMAVFGILVVLFFQQRLDKVSQAVVVQPLMTAGVGLLTLVALVVTAVTIILLPVALVALIPLGFAWLFGVIAIGREIGERFSTAIRQDWTPVLTTGLGTFILMFIVGSIQSLNNLSWLVGCFTWILPAFVGLLAVGAVVITRFGIRPVPSPVMSVYSPPAEPGGGASAAES